MNDISARVKNPSSKRRNGLNELSALGNCFVPMASYMPRVKVDLEETLMEDTLTQNYNRDLENKASEAGNLRDRASGAVSGALHRGKDVASHYLDSEPKASPRREHREGPIARAIEQQTARIPSDAWLWAAVGSIGLSLAFEIMGEEKKANFVGHWAPTLLIFGLYNKVVKLQGSDGV